MSSASEVRVVPASMPVSYESYKRLVEECARRRLNYDIANGSPHHARVLIAKLFEIAATEVVIVTGSLTDTTKNDVDVYGFGEVTAAASKFLKSPGTLLQIIVQSGSIQHGDENKFLQATINDHNRNGDITIIKPQTPETLRNVPHFMVADSAAYRLETAVNARPAVGEMTAVANFGNRETARNLREFFGELDEFMFDTQSSRTNYSAGEFLK